MIPLIAVLLVLASPAPVAEEHSPTTTNLVGAPVVIDGDTLRFDKERVRLFGIDAPEGKQSCTRDRVPWLCGQEAAKYLRELVAGEYLSCAERNRDRYGRIVGVCTLADGRDLGQVMVEAGYALAYRQYGGKLYDAAERSAKGERRGLWAGEFMAPWEWRRAGQRSFH